MKLRRHVGRKKIGGEGRNDNGRMKGRRAGGGGFIYPAGRSLAASPARWFCASLEVSHLSSHPKWQLSPYSCGKGCEANTDSIPVRTRLGQQTISHFQLTGIGGYRSQLPSSVQSHPLHTRWFATLFTLDDRCP